MQEVEKTLRSVILELVKLVFGNESRTVRLSGDDNCNVSAQVLPLGDGKVRLMISQYLRDFGEEDRQKLAKWITSGSLIFDKLNNKHVLIVPNDIFNSLCQTPKFMVRNTVSKDLNVEDAEVCLACFQCFSTGNPLVPKQAFGLIPKAMDFFDTVKAM